MKTVKGVVRPYAWGSRTALAELQGRPAPSPHPEAELWFGAHPAAPAAVDDAAKSDLLAVIDDDPLAALGATVAETYEQRLPFLVKILAADEPLSLQAHPSAEQARIGFAAENRAGLAVDDPRRNYRDSWHKPEIVVALSDFEALAGQRLDVDRLELRRWSIGSVDRRREESRGQRCHGGERQCPEEMGYGDIRLHSDHLPAGHSLKATAAGRSM